MEEGEVRSPPEHDQRQELQQKRQVRERPIYAANHNKINNFPSANARAARAGAQYKFTDPASHPRPSPTPP